MIAQVGGVLYHISRTTKVELAIKNNYFLNFEGEQKLEIVDALVFLIPSWEARLCFCFPLAVIFNFHLTFLKQHYRNILVMYNLF